MRFEISLGLVLRNISFFHLLSELEREKIFYYKPTHPNCLYLSGDRFCLCYPYYTPVQHFIWWDDEMHGETSFQEVFDQMPEEIKKVFIECLDVFSDLKKYR